MTPHIGCEKGDIANIVLAAGDPKRVSLIANKYLEEVRLVSDVRGELIYTGKYKGKDVSVVSHGMGIPSMGIYSYELFKFFDVDYIIRIGTAGAYTKDLNCYDLMLATSAYSESTYGIVQNGETEDIKDASEQLNRIILNRACGMNQAISAGRVHSKDVFYAETNDFKHVYQDLGCLAVEMESFSLFHNAKVLGKKAACLLTISDSLVTGETTSAEARTNKVMSMVELALNSILDI